ncbi:hypothetical protein TNCV_4934491 [Trichonephila clavipes]|nr:hypothetical protein TNCV_4934491 [Trichonephila clavipes]
MCSSRSTKLYLPKMMLLYCHVKNGVHQQQYTFRHRPFNTTTTLDDLLLECVWNDSVIRDTLCGGCKEPLPAPGNRSNERRYREKDLATTGEKKVGTGEKRERGCRKKPGS